MGLIDIFKDKKLFIDTAPLIYYIEGHSKYQKVLDELFQSNVKGHIEFITSTLTLLELLVQPIRLNRLDLVENYEKIIIESKSIETLNLDIEIAKRASELRANYNIKTPDSIQLATAIESSCDYFITNDKKLKIKEIKTVMIDEIGHIA